MKKMFFAVCLMAVSAVLSAQVPSWVTTRPVHAGKYVGIGMASVQEDDYQTKATMNALKDIASQISVKLESSSFMQIVEVDDNSKSLFEEKVTESVAADIEGHELKDTYSDSRMYYVYYELDVRKYEKLMEAKKEKGISLGLDWYIKGQNAEELNNLSGAAQLYGNGLKAVEPYLHMDFGTVDIAGIIYYIVNVPIFIVAYRKLGKRFFVKTVITVTASTLILSLIPPLTIVEDVMASCMVGGIVSGAGVGMILRMGSSGGGR